MKQLKKLFAALSVVALLISMLSCMVFSASAAMGDLGEPVSIEKVDANGGIVVSGKALPENVTIVNSDWKGTKGVKSLKLDGVVYSGTMGTNAFGELADAVAACGDQEVIYVAAGTYEEGITVSKAGLKVYGPYAGVCPNAANIKDANSARPAAASKDADPSKEAIFTGTFTVEKVGSDFTIDGVYFSGSAAFASAGTMGGNANYRYGTYIRNCLVNSTGGQLVAYTMGNNPDIVFENNRVLNGKGLMSVAGMMNVQIKNNYLNLSDVTMDLKWVTAGSMGSATEIIGNYYENCGGFFRYNNLYQTVLYSAIIRNNIVADMGAAPLVLNTFYAANTLPGTNIQFTGNKIMGMEKGVTAFEFPYEENQSNVNRFRFIININENYFDIPADTMFVESSMNGVLNLANNYYASPISVGRVSKYEETDLVLFPYYTDPEMTTLAGDATFTWAMDGATIDSANKIVTIDLTGTTLDYVDLSLALQVQEGNSWKLFEEETLETEIKDKILYFDGVSTERYAAVEAADGSTVVYTIRVLRGIGTEAKLIDLVFDNSLVSDAIIEGNTFTYNFPSDLAFASYDVRVSSGATYEIYKKFSQTTAPSEAYPELGDYIPYGGFEFDIVVTAEDNPMNKQVYHIVLNRDFNALYDPSIMGINSPAGEYTVRKSRAEEKLVLTYYAPYLMTAAKFDLQPTFGATYTIYELVKKQDGTMEEKELSSSANIRELKLKDGTNNFYIKAELKDGDKTYTNVMDFVIENVKKSSDAAIVGLSGLSATVNGNKIVATSVGDSFGCTILTKSPYATVDVYADPSCTLKLAYTSDPHEEEPNRIVDERSFTLESCYAINRYFAVCTAEDGVTKATYEINILRQVQVNTYADVADDAWYARYVSIATEGGFVQGSKSGEKYYFRPNDKTTRQEMAVVAARVMGINVSAFADVKLEYKDVAKIADWAKPYVQVVNYLGVMKGDGTNFNPHASITRQEVMAMFARMYNLKSSCDLTKFKDYSKIAGWAKKDVAAIVAEGWVSGDDNGYLNPQRAITRAELSTILALVG